MRSFILAAAFVAATCATPHVDRVSAAFSEFKTKFNKVYDVADEAYKLSVFAENMKFIAQHNAEASRGLHTHTVGIGPFADLTNAEFKAAYTTPFERTMPYNVVSLPIIAGLAGTMNATSKDWRTEGAVTGVKNQGTCGSCWSFSTTGSTEGAWKIAGNDLVSLSEQQLMDCSKAEGNKGCQGGLMDDAFQYIIKNGGLDSEADYGYTMKNGVCDTAKAAKHVAAVASFKDVPQNNEAQLLAAVTQQPVSVAIEADKPAFQHYKSGVLTNTACGEKLDHGVLVVGYGTDAASSADYWIVKNSWGASWGEEGYIRLGRGLDSPRGLCGINEQPSWPTAGKPGPSPPPGPPSPPAGKCAVPNAERKRCGFLVSKSGCEAKGCCYDDTNPFADHCFYPADGPTPPPPPGPPSSKDPYADPNDGPCPAGSSAVQIQGLAGSFCSPTCSQFKPCPVAPDGISATPQCALESSGSSTPTQCALICPPGKDGLKGAAGECPEKATCKKIQTTGLCTYDSR